MVFSLSNKSDEKTVTFDTCTSIAKAIKIKVNSKRYRKRDSNSILYFTVLHFELLRMIETNKCSCRKTNFTANLFQFVHF